MKPKRKRDFTGMFIMAVLLSFILPLGYLVVRVLCRTAAGRRNCAAAKTMC